MDIKIKTEHLKFKYRVSGIIILDHQLLVERYTKDSYCLPGGYVNMGETSEEAILRELKEEINVDFQISKFAGIAENFFVNFKGEQTHSIDFYYYVSFQNKEDIHDIDYKRLEDDHGKMVQHDLKWIDLDALKNVELKPSTIRDAIIHKKENFHYMIHDESVQ